MLFDVHFKTFIYTIDIQLKIKNHVTEKKHVKI